MPTKWWTSTTFWMTQLSRTFSHRIANPSWTVEEDTVWSTHRKCSSMSTGTTFKRECQGRQRVIIMRRKRSYRSWIMWGLRSSQVNICPTKRRRLNRNAFSFSREMTWGEIKLLNLSLLWQSQMILNITIQFQSISKLITWQLSSVQMSSWVFQTWYLILKQSLGLMTSTTSLEAWI